MNIIKAGIEDFEGVKSLLKANHINYIAPEEKINGFVTTNLTDEQLEALIVEDNGVTVAKEGNRVLAFALAAAWDFWKEWPLFAHMIEILPSYTFNGQVLTTKNSYQYGPICLDKSIRGTGVFEQVFFASLKSMSGQYPIMITFVNQINPRSYAAHTKKAHMSSLGTFQFNQNNYHLLACPTSHCASAAR